MKFWASVLQHTNLARLFKHAAINILILSLMQLICFLVPLPIFSVFALIVFLYFVVGLSKYAPASFILLLTFMFLRVTCLISGISIEYGAEMIELDLIGHATGSMLRLVMVYIFILTVAALIIEPFYNHFKENIEPPEFANQLQNQSWIIVLFAVTLLLTLVVLIIGAKTGFPMITGLSRLAFREEVNSKFFLLYISNRKIFILLLGVVYVTCLDYKRKFSLGLYFLTILVAILFGEKFTSIITLSVLMFIPSLLLSKRLNNLNLVKLAIPMILLTLFTLPIILHVYGWSDDPELAIAKLTYRFAGQAQLWFVADSEMKDFFAFDLASLLHNFKSFIQLNNFELVNTAPYFGARYFMYHFMSDDLLFLFLETKALTLTMAFEPYLLMTNGWVGQLLPLTICTVVYALNLSYLAYGIFKANPISLFFAVKLLIWSSLVVQQGELYFMFGIKFLLVSSLAMVYEKKFLTSNSLLFLRRNIYGRFTN